MNNSTHAKKPSTYQMELQYHVVFVLKYRRKAFFGEKRVLKDIIRTLCDWRDVEIIKGEICLDHIHLMLSIPPKYSVSGFMGYLSLMIF